MDLKFKLTEALDTIITDKHLEGLTEKQINYLKMLVENVLTPNENAFYYRSKEDSLVIIKDILKIKPKYIDKKDFLLINKKII